eukprot:1959128-Pyramimonas_sp.AAC.1
MFGALFANLSITSAWSRRTCMQVRTYCIGVTKPGITDSSYTLIQRELQVADELRPLETGPTREARCGSLAGTRKFHMSLPTMLPFGTFTSRAQLQWA